MQETFKYIISVLPSYELFHTELKIISYNEKELTIEMGFCYDASARLTFSLNDIKSVEYKRTIWKEGVGTLHSANKDDAESIQILTYSSVEYHPGDCYNGDERRKLDGLDLYKKDPVNSLEKIYKAFNHVIDLNGNKVNPDLFGH